MLGRSLLAALVLALTSASPALADSAKLTFSPDAVAGVSRTATLSGTTTATHAWVRSRPAGGAPCATSASADPGTPLDALDGAAVSGDYTVSKSVTWPSPGTYTFCVWLADTASTPAPPVSQDVTFRAPVATIGSKVTPSATDPSQFTVTITATSDAPQPVYALVRPAGAPCAASFGADHGVVLASGPVISGTVSISHGVTASPGAQYVVCAWLGSAPPQSTTFSTPPITCGTPGPPTVTITSRCTVPVPRQCTVPSPARRLAAAKARLRTAGCRVGSITHARSHKYARGRVIRYTLEPGRRFAFGTKVGIVVSRGPR